MAPRQGLAVRWIHAAGRQEVTIQEIKDETEIGRGGKGWLRFKETRTDLLLSSVLVSFVDRVRNDEHELNNCATADV